MTDLTREQIESAGYAAGFSKGMSEARRVLQGEQTRSEAMRTALQAQAAHQAEQDSALAQSAYQALSQAAIPAVQSAEASIVRYAVSLCESILGVALDDADSRAAIIVANALERAPEQIAPVSLYVAPADEAKVLNLLEDASVRVIADPSMRIGDARAEYPDGWLEASVQAAFERVKAELLAVTGQEAA